MYQSLKLKPGINVELTPLLNSAGWSFGSAIRFRDGQPEKIGGWSHLNSTALVGVCTGMHAWADLASNLYIACGTDQRLQLFNGGLMQDITPLRLATNNAPLFSTTSGSKVVTIKDPANGAAVGDWVDVLVPVSVGGVVIQGFYQVQSIVDADHYTILASINATANITDGGAVPTFTTVMGSGNVTITLNNHALVAGGIFTVQVATAVGGITIAANMFSVVAPVTANTFVIQPGSVAGSNDVKAENAGNVILQYLVASGPQSATVLSTSGGYGVGGYGVGPYGVSTSGTITVPLRQWFLDNFGQDGVGNYTGSPIFVWTPPAAIGNVALAINTTNYPGALDPPKQVNFSFVAGPQQQIIAGGCDDPVAMVFDPCLVRFCDQRDFTIWRAASTNLAGSFRIPSGSRLVGGISAPNFTVLWTDVDMWLMNYLGGAGGYLSQLVWGFNKVAGSTGLLSARACGLYGNLAFYASSDGVYVFNGSQFKLIPCPVWDKFWKNLNRAQVDKVTMQVNSFFQELSLASPSLSGDGTVDQRITYNIREGVWTYDDAPTMTARTAWIDENVYGSPAGTDLSGYIQQQDGEGVYDADGQALPSSIRSGWFSAQEGSLVSMMERIEADLIVTGGSGTIFVTVYAQDYAVGPVRTYGPYAWVVGSGPPQAIVRARGRFLSIQISSAGLGVFWRLGDLRYRIQQSGKRP